jgi:hypothetical protein
MELSIVRRWLYTLLKARAERLLPMDRRAKH